MKYILENIYTSNNCYIIKYDGNKYMRIGSDGLRATIDITQKNDLNLLFPNADLYVLYKFPFKIIRLDDGKIIMSFLSLLNSYITFYIVHNMLFMVVNLDNTTIKVSYVYTNNIHNSGYVQIYVQGAKPDDIQKLTYLHDTQIYNMGTRANPFIYVYMPIDYMDKLVDMSRSYRWKLVCGKIVMF